MTAARRRPSPATAAAVAAVLFLVAVALLGARPASGQEGSGASLVLRQVDATEPDDTAVQFVYTGAEGDIDGAQLIENGTTVDAAVEPLPADTPMSIALVFDTATAMDDSGALVEAKEAAKEWVRGRTGDEATFQAFGVFAASDTGFQVQDFTTNTERILAAIDRVAPPSTDEARQQSALWSAVSLASAGLGERSGQPNLVLFTGTGNTVSGSSQGQASAAITASGATVFVAELLSDSFNPAPVDALVATNGGLVVRTSDGTAFGDLVDELAVAVGDQQYVATYESRQAPGNIADLDLQVGDQATTASIVIGSNVQGKVALNPEVKPPSGGIDALQGNLGLLLLIVVVLAAVGLLAYGVFAIFVREDRLASVLQPYDAAVLGVSPDEAGDTSYAQTTIVQRAVELTEQVAQERGLLVKAENALERANLPLRTGEALFFYAALVVLLTTVSLILGGLIVGLIVGVIAAILPVAVVNFLAAQRRRKFLSLLPDTLSLLAGTLRAGYSLMQGVEAVSQEVEEPMGQELRRVVTEARLGRPLEEALDGTAERMASPDFAWAVMAIRIQREVGGNLAELLLTVADTMVQRERLRRDVAALTAEGRMSAIILGALPVGLGGIMFMLNPDYSRQLIDTTFGNIMLGGAVLGMLVGFAWMKKIITIEI